jgi:hypothetical protein
VSSSRMGGMAFCAGSSARRGENVFSIVMAASLLLSNPHYEITLRISDSWWAAKMFVYKFSSYSDIHLFVVTFAANVLILRQ